MKAKPKQKPVTLGELRDLWIEYMKLKGRSRAEVEKANSTFNRALAFLGGPERDATTMRAIDFERYQAHLQTLRPKTRGGARLAPKTVNWKPGMRVGNLVPLRWTQIDLHRRTVSLPANETKQRKRLVVPLSHAAIKALTDWGEDPILHYRVNRASDAFRMLTKCCKINNLRFHDLRPTAASRLRRNGVDIFTIMAIMGWSNMRMAARYQTIHRADKLKAIDQAAEVDAVPKAIALPAPSGGGVATIEAVAAQLGGASVAEIEELIAQGALQTVSFSGRRLVRAASLEAFLASLPPG